MPAPKKRRLTRRRFLQLSASAFAPDRRLYVNRSLGHLRQARFLARPEITRFTLDTTR